MKYRFETLIISAVAFSTASLCGQQPFTGPAQAARGMEIFTKTAKPAACATCHSIGAKTPTAGPDLKMWSKMAPRATAMAITATLTEKSLWVETKQGPAFPGMKVSEDDTSMQVFDLSKTPPELRTLAKADVTSAKSNTTWKHPPGTEKYSLEDLADVVAYIRWAGSADKRPVAPGDVQ